MTQEKTLDKYKELFEKDNTYMNRTVEEMMQAKEKARFEAKKQAEEKANMQKMDQTDNANSEEVPLIETATHPDE